MKFGILGTGTVGRTIARKLASLGHEVTMGTRDPSATKGRSEPGAWGAPSFADWYAANTDIHLATFADTASGAEVLVNASSGGASLAVFEAAGAANLAGKVVLDIANPLDFSNGFPPSLSVSNTDSLGEQIQRAFPEARIVKTLNTVNADLMVNPASLADGDHTMFVCGNDADAKGVATRILAEDFGWKDIVDLGDITQARGTEMYLPLWVRLYGKLGTAAFNLKLVR
ncbi:MAG: NAD(P)-binding domain-containing protein [Alphaproteobacteria bacterium]|nr:NAD(P)-binding domain-containing protein [Alphaproteobacteria bacterium]